MLAYKSRQVGRAHDDHRRVRFPPILSQTKSVNIATAYCAGLPEHEN